MATIAALAIKVSANIADLEKKFKTVNSSIGSIVQTAQNAAPSMKSLEDVSQGLAATYDAVAEAAKRVNDNPLDLENQQILARTQEAAQKLNEEMKRIGQGIGDDILKMKPTLNNVFKAQEMVEQLKAKFGETSPIVQQATANIGQLAQQAAETKMQMQGLKAVIFSINNAPFMILASVFKDLWDRIVKGLAKYLIES